MASGYNQDRFRKDGAEVLARTIKRYWRTQGFDVNAWVEPLTDMTAVACLTENARKRASEEVLYVVRSDLVNGLPRPKTMALAA